jgi:Zn-finger nucleic acid-binding protein
MNCPSCGAPMRLKPDMTSFKCEYCLSVYLPETNADDGVRVLGEPSGQDCPICSTGLMHATLSNIRIRYCTKCHGMLVAMEILQSLVEDLQAEKRAGTIQPPADAADLRRKINCPQCRHRMDAHFYAGPGNVVIDSCENCSLIWLDGGELMRIVRAPEEQFATTETFLSSPSIDPTPSRADLTDSAADIALIPIDPLFLG